MRDILGAQYHFHIIGSFVLGATGSAPGSASDSDDDNGCVANPNSSLSLELLLLLFAAVLAMGRRKLMR